MQAHSRISLSESGDTGERAVHATGTIGQGEEIFRIPASLLLSAPSPAVGCGPVLLGISRSASAGKPRSVWTDVTVGVLSPLLLHSRPASRRRSATTPQAAAGLLDLLLSLRLSEFDTGSSDKFFSGENVSEMFRRIISHSSKLCAQLRDGGGPWTAHQAPFVAGAAASFPECALSSSR